MGRLQCLHETRETDADITNHVHRRTRETKWRFLASGTRWLKPAGVSAIRHPDVMEYLRQARVVEGNRRLEHCGVPDLQMVCDDPGFGVPDLRRREQSLLTMDALDGVHHPRSSHFGVGAFSAGRE